MTKDEINKELGNLIYRFKVLKKALAEEEKEMTPLEKAMAETAKAFAKPKPAPKLTREQVLAKAKEMFEQQQAQRLANQLQKTGILGTRPPPRQPTNEEMAMYAHQQGVPTQEELEKQEAGWGNSINNWLSEATKPLNQRFNSEEEERAYWDNIKVNGGGGDHGY